MNARARASTTYPITWLMVDSISHITGLTGLAPTVTISKNGGAFGAAAGAVAEIGNGWYSLAGNAVDRDTLGELAIHVTAAGADPVDFKVDIIAQDPFATNFAMLNVSANIEQISDDGTAAQNAEAFFDGTGYAGTGNTIPNVTTVGSVTGSVASVTGGINTAAGVITTLDGLDTAQDAQHATTQADIAALNDLSAAQVNAEVVDVMAVDTHAQPGQATPAATMSYGEMLRYLFKAWRNKHTQTALEYNLYNDDGVTVDQQAATTDDGVTFTRDEIVTGP